MAPVIDELEAYLARYRRAKQHVASYFLPRADPELVARAARRWMEIEADAATRSPMGRLGSR